MYVYQMATKYTKWPKIYQITVKYTKWTQNILSSREIDQHLPLQGPRKCTQYRNLPSGSHENSVAEICRIIASNVFADFWGARNSKCRDKPSLV
jgi:hypothetical protein